MLLPTTWLSGVFLIALAVWFPVTIMTSTGISNVRIAHLEVARTMGYRSCYLETLTGMDRAIRLYTRLGFRSLCAPLGRTGHGGCDHWFAMELK